MSRQVNKSPVQRSLKSEDRYIGIVEHVLAALDYVSDMVHVFYGHPGAYGIVSQPMTTNEGINTFLQGYIASENVRFREDAITFKMSMEDEKEEQKTMFRFPYDAVILLQSRMHHALANDRFRDEVLKPLKMPDLYSKTVKTLSGGDAQRVAIVLCLGKPADLYLLDEPSTFLDVEMRLVAAKVIKRFIMNSNKTAFVIEHDYTMSTYLADRVILFTGEPAISCSASTPISKECQHHYAPVPRQRTVSHQQARLGARSPTKTRRDLFF